MDRTTELYRKVGSLGKEASLAVVLGTPYPDKVGELLTKLESIDGKKLSDINVSAVFGSDNPEWIATLTDFIAACSCCPYSSVTVPLFGLGCRAVLTRTDNTNPSLVLHYPHISLQQWSGKWQDFDDNGIISVIAFQSYSKFKLVSLDRMAMVAFDQAITKPDCPVPPFNAVHITHYLMSIARLVQLLLNLDLFEETSFYYSYSTSPFHGISFYVTPTEIEVGSLEEDQKILGG
jgi:hypothetical protein